jgi:ABC-type phosphate transport system auxiliary subunit
MDDNPANQWLKDNLFGHEPNPVELFIDRRVPGTYNRILALDNNAKEKAIKQTKNELRNRLPKMNELIDQLADTKRTRDDLRVQYGYDFDAMTNEQLERLNNLNDKMERIHKEAKWISSNKYKNMLKMKIGMLRHQF